LLEHTTQEKAAAAAGVSTVTLWRWQRKPEFQKALLQARRDAYSQAVARLQQGAAAAAATLLRVMCDTAAPPASRVRAAQCVLDNAARGIGLQDLDVRLRELEKSGAMEASRQPVPKIATFMREDEHSGAQGLEL
jgi:hypothetical protein